MLSYFCEDDSVTVPEELEIDLGSLSIDTLTEYPLDKNRSCDPVARDTKSVQKVTLYPNAVTFLLANGKSLFEE